MTRPPSALVAVALLLTVWISGRIVWEVAHLPAIPASAAKPEKRASFAHTGPPVPAVVTASRMMPHLTSQESFTSFQGFHPSSHPEEILGPLVNSEREARFGRVDSIVEGKAPVSAFPVIKSPETEGRGPDSILASIWVFGQVDGRGRTLAPAGQLGGSQAGIRVRAGLAEIWPGLSMGSNVRLSSSLSAPLAKEAAIGFSLRHAGPVTGELIVERRIGLSRGARNAAAIVGVVGVDSVDLLEGVSFAGYAQAGLVGLKALDGFVDGAARFEHRVAAFSGSDAAVSLNGRFAVQPGLSRIDIGPGVAVPLRLPGGNGRFSIEWRMRVSGNARPASGPAITLGADF